jgi:hypothetical protein
METFIDQGFVCSLRAPNQVTASFERPAKEEIEYFTDDDYDFSCSDEESTDVRLGFDEICERENNLQNEISLIHSLSLKFGAVNGAVLANFSKAFWKKDALYKKAMQFLCMFYTSLKSKHITIGKNWQRKRYCNDVSYLLILMNLPRLCYFDTKIRPTALCKSFFSSCEKSNTAFWALKPSKNNKEHKRWIDMKNKAYLESDYQGMYDQKSLPFAKRYSGLSRQQVDNHKDEDFIGFRNGTVKIEGLQVGRTKPGTVFVEKCMSNQKSVSETKRYLEAAMRGQKTCCKKVLEKILVPSVKKVLIESKKNVNAFINKLNSSEAPEEWKKPKSVFRFKHNKSEYTAQRNYFEPLLKNYCEDLDEKIKSCSRVSDTLNKDELNAVSLVASELRLNKAIMHNQKRKDKEWKETGSKWKKKGIYLKKLAKAKKDLSAENENKSATVTGLKIKFYQQKRNIKLIKIKKQRIFHSIVKMAGEIPEYLENVILFPDLKIVNWDNRAEFSVDQKQLTYHDWYHGIKRERLKPEKKVNKNPVPQRKSRAERRFESQKHWFVNTEDDDSDDAIYIDF